MVNRSPIMASAICTPNSSLSSSSSNPSLCAFLNSSILIPKNMNVQYLKCIPQLGLGLSSPWNGLKNLGISISQHSVKIGTVLVLLWARAIINKTKNCMQILCVNLLLEYLNYNRNGYL